MGFYNQTKVNKANWLDYRYEKEKWYKFDILLDWDDKNVAIFIDGVFIRTTGFYS